MNHFKCFLLFVCSPVNTTFMHYLKTEAVFQWFYCSIFDTPFCYFLEQPIHAFREQVTYCLFQSFLKCFDIFLEQTKEIMYWKWNTALTGWHVLFRHIFYYFCLHMCAPTNHNNVNFLLIN